MGIKLELNGIYRSRGGNLVTITRHWPTSSCPWHGTAEYVNGLLAYDDEGTCIGIDKEKLNLLERIGTYTPDFKMTSRAQIAAQVMAGMAAYGSLVESQPDLAAAAAVRAADALLNELNKK